MLKKTYTLREIITISGLTEYQFKNLVRKKDRNGNLCLPSFTAINKGHGSNANQYSAQALRFCCVYSKLREFGIDRETCEAIYQTIDFDSDVAEYNSDCLRLVIDLNEVVKKKEAGRKITVNLPPL